MKSFDDVCKDMTVSSVHVPTILGNEKPKRKAKGFRAAMSDEEDAKSVTKRIAFTFTKADVDRRLIFGWASISTIQGEPVIDKQGDVIPTDELETAAYDYVLNSRLQGDLHEVTGVGRLVESCMFTAEKQAVLGIDLGKEGWWVGFYVDDDDVWTAIKNGERPEFSIGGAGERVPLETE